MGATFGSPTSDEKKNTQYTYPYPPRTQTHQLYTHSRRTYLERVARGGGAGHAGASQHAHAAHVLGGVVGAERGGGPEARGQHRGLQSLVLWWK